MDGTANFHHQTKYTNLRAEIYFTETPKKAQAERDFPTLFVPVLALALSSQLTIV